MLSNPPGGSAKTDFVIVKQLRLAITFASHANVKTDFTIAKQPRLTSTFASHAKLLPTQANYAKDQTFTAQVSLWTHLSLVHEKYICASICFPRKPIMQRTTLSHVSEPTFPTSESVDTCIIVHLDSAEKYHLASAFSLKHVSAKLMHFQWILCTNFFFQQNFYYKWITWHYSYI